MNTFFETKLSCNMEDTYNHENNSQNSDNTQIYFDNRQHKKLKYN